jgi:hypothetical protein
LHEYSIKPGINRFCFPVTSQKILLHYSKNGTKMGPGMRGGRYGQ